MDRNGDGYRPGYVEGKERINIYIDEELARKLRVRAAETKESMSAIVERALRKELGEEGVTHDKV